MATSGALALVLSISTFGAPQPAGAATIDPPVRVSNVVTGLPEVPPPSFYAGIGPFGLIIHDRHLLVSDADNQGFYSFGAAGSSAPVPLSTGNVQTGLAIGRHGKLYAALYQAGNIDEVDPLTGAFIRQLNPPGTQFPCITGLASDPLTGDLFFGQPNSGGICPGNPALTRIENPDSANPTFVSYTSEPGVYYDRLAISKDGTIYAVQQVSSSGCVVRIGGTDTPAPPQITTLACFPNFENEFIGVQTVAVAPSGDPTPIVYAAGPNGTISEINQRTSPATVTPLVTLPTRVDGLAVSRGGYYLFATQSTSIVRISHLGSTPPEPNPLG